MTVLLMMSLPVADCSTLILQGMWQIQSWSDKYVLG